MTLLGTSAVGTDVSSTARPIPNPMRSSSIDRLRPIAAQTRAMLRRRATRTPAVRKTSATQGSQVPVAMIRRYAAWTVGIWSDWAIGNRPVDGRYAAAMLIPRATRAALTSSTMGPSWTPIVPSAEAAIRAFGSLFSVASNWVCG